MCDNTQSDYSYFTSYRNILLLCMLLLTILMHSTFCHLCHFTEGCRTIIPILCIHTVKGLLKPTEEISSCIPKTLLCLIETMNTRHCH